MALKKIICSCFCPKNSSPKRQSKVAKEVSLQRLLLSDVSDPNSPFLIHDLSNSLLGSNLHIFTLAELRLITSNFSKYNFLGEGGFGPVYKGFIDDKLCPGSKPQPVAVKVLNLNGSQGHKEWLAEVIILGQLRHPNLVKLIGCCCEDEHRLIVYEYMERGNLDNQLFRGYSACIPWSTRIKIALGAAKGLAFLHEEETPVIYRDFKASNILLDSDYRAKLSDFGLATDGPDGGDTHISTEVMGTHGYAAPEYVKTGHLTTMSDVFSFGVVLLELLTGRRSVDKNRRSRHQNLVEYARPLLKDPNKLDRIMDSRLEGQYSIEGAKKAALVAHQCLSSNPKNRPTMRRVVKTLEILIGYNDIPSGPFVYIVPTEGRNKIHSCEEVKGQQDEIQVEKVECDKQDRGNNNEELEKKRIGHPRHRKRHRKNRHGIKSWRSRAVYSDTDLYRKLGSTLYSRKPTSKDNKDAFSLD